MPDGSGSLEVVVDRAWLVPRLSDPAIVVADVRWYLDGRSGRAAYEAGHIPGAVFVDVAADLSAPTHERTAGRHPLPNTAAFARSMGAAGIGDAETVVAYDDSGGGTAGRLVWMLRATGHRAALLDGGLRTWQGSLEAGPGAAHPARVLTVPDDWPSDRLAHAEDVARPGRAVVLDARAGDRYRGEVEPIDARPGHIPGARSAPWTDNLTADGRFRAGPELRDHYSALGIGGDGDVVAYCGSGVSACADLLALEHAGLGVGRLFVPSWSGWSADPDRPAATGPDPG